MTRPFSAAYVRSSGVVACATWHFEGENLGEPPNCYKECHT